KKLIPFLTLALAAAVCTSPASAQAEKKKGGGGGAPKQQPLVPNPRLSPHETVFNRLGEGANRTLVSITYGRPYAAKGGKGDARKIYGGLVPWDKADRLGSDEATLLVTQRALDFNGTVIPAGAHTLYYVPSETGTSKLVFSSIVGKWGVPVDETKDTARVDLKKEALSEAVDQLTIVIETPSANQGVLKIKWEKTQFSVPFTVKG
ncbi:MAG: DUF2911 domain-containing protein, partial [Verrucomicrobiota bacterium]